MSDNQLFETLTQAVPGLVWVSDEQGRVEFNNAHWTEFTGMPQGSGHGHGWLNAIHPVDAAAFREQLPLPSLNSETVQARIRVRRHDGVFRVHLLSVREAGRGRWVGCAIDAHDLLSAELRDANQSRILEMVVAGTELKELLTELCRAAESQIPGATCSVLLVDSSKGVFTSGVAPGLPVPVMASLPGLKIGTGVGSCGTAAFEKRDVVTTDISSDPLWEGWRDAVLPLGLNACWSRAVLSSKNEVIASLGFYFSEPREPSQDDLRELAHLRDLASLAIERARMLEALRESEEHYRHTVEQNPQIPWTADPMGRVLSVSTRWIALTGLELNDSLGNGWLKALHPDDVGPTMENWDEVLSTGNSLDINYRIRTKGGQYRWARVRAIPRRDASGKIVRWYGTVEDIHERYLADQKLRIQAFQDDLTGLPNRRRFVDELQRRLRSAAEPVGLMVLDMDDFKLVNDRYGHLTGDAVLRLFGRYLERTVDPSDFVARLGGDEFAIICRHTLNETVLLERARRIESSLDARLRSNKKSRSCRPSIGCTVGQHGENPDEVFKRADLALYAAKAAGKGTTRLFDPTIRSAASRRAEALELARSALREGWITPYYQPIVHLSSQEVGGLEALLRVRHPRQGVLAPAAIRESLDDPRLANAITERMTKLVIADMSRWLTRGLEYGRVSINLATENLVNAEFTSTLLELLGENPVARNSLKLEITERVLMDELGDVIGTNLNRLRDAGVAISLDDFGTGYASLVHLQTLPVDKIKIDRSFVAGLGTDSNRGEIVQAMLGLARQLGLSTVAEGIEKPGEVLKLTSWGCECGQGFYFSKPLPSDEVETWLRQNTSRLRLSG